jgi:carboxypeptidase Q
MSIQPLRIAEPVPRRPRGVFLLPLALAFAGSAMATSLSAQERVDMAAVNRIKDEGFNRSQVMDIASWLTDVYGPRLTNSPQMHAAGEYTMGKFREWGLTNPHYHWFDFGRGWQNDRTVAHVVSPTPYPVLAYPGAWTVGTNGPITADVVIVDLPPNSPVSDYARFRGQLRGKIVLASQPANVTPPFEPIARRHEAEGLDRMAAARIIPAPPLAGAPQTVAPGGRGGRGGGGGGGGGGRGVGPGAAGDGPPVMTAAARNQFFIDEGVAALLMPGSGRGNSGSVSNGPTGNRQPNALPSIPQVAVAAEHYGRMYRQIERGVPVRMELDVRNTFTSNDLRSFNIIAEIPGTDKRDEVVMIGAHFDSWHSGTGATDNGGSSAVMMEAMRILKATGVPLRRTVRIGLWTGEEQGLIGSRAYVADTFGSRAEPRPANSKISLYLNQDNGGGAIRGFYAQGNEGVMPIFTEWMKAVDSDSITVRHVTINSTGSTDHVPFDAAGVPGFQFIQDPMDYGSRTHHSSQDLYERLVATDMRHNSVAIAVFVMLAANRDELLPRK